MDNKIVARLNWGAFDHASHAPQLRSCNYYLQNANDYYMHVSLCNTELLRTKIDLAPHAQSMYGVVMSTCPCQLKPSRI